MIVRKCWMKLIKKSYIVTKIYISNRYCSFELIVKESGRKKSWFQQKKLSIINIDSNKKYAPNQHIRMISEGLCDIEDCM